MTTRASSTERGWRFVGVIRGFVPPEAGEKRGPRE
jgi:hypothetical protein